MRALGWGLDSLPRIARGEGSYLYETTGRWYLDGSGGSAEHEARTGHKAVQYVKIRRCGTTMLGTGQELLKRSPDE